MGGEGEEAEHEIDQAESVHVDRPCSERLGGCHGERYGDGGKEDHDGSPAAFEEKVGDNAAAETPHQ